MATSSSLACTMRMAMPSVGGGVMRGMQRAAATAGRSSTSVAAVARSAEMRSGMATLAVSRQPVASSSASESARGLHASSSWWRANSSQARLRQTHQQRRQFHASTPAQHGGIDRPEPGTGIKVVFRDAKGEDIKSVEANEGDDLLSVAHEYDIDLEGACEGSIACSTCHVILEPDVYDSLEEPGDDENDMLDLAFGLTDTSRLGCQVKLAKAQDGMVVQLPSATRNMRVDGSKPSH